MKTENKEFIIVPDITDKKKIALEWLHIWSEVLNYYGDIQKKENAQQFLERLQATYFKSPAPPEPKEVKTPFELIKAHYLTEDGMPISYSINQVEAIAKEYAQQFQSTPISQKWISVEERLPDTRRNVLFVADKRDYANDDNVVKGYYDKETNLWFCQEAHEDEFFKAIKWMEIPKP